MNTDLSRRAWLSALGTGLAGASLTPLQAGQPAPDSQAIEAAAAGEAPPTEPFRYCLNTSTVRGQKLSLPEQVDLAAQAGYHAIEPWLPEIRQYIEEGGSLKDLDKRIRDQGLTVESAIGFAEWIVDDEDRRKQGLEQARREMGWLSEIGGKRIAAPPAGATQESVDLLRAAEHYRALLELGDQMGIVPQVEVWGFSQSLSRLGETALVAIESGHPSACVLPDVYHLHKGGSPFTGLLLVSGSAMHVFHINDYPDDPPRATITDAHRVYPGDGVAPLKDILRGLRDVGFRGFLSLELFNRDYWQQDALQVARTGLAKMRAAVQNALEG